MNKKKKKSGSPFPIVLILIIAGVAGSNFAGPSKGWLTKAINSGREVPQSEVGLQETETSTETKLTDSDKSKQVKQLTEKTATKTEPKKPMKEAKPDSGAMSEIEKLHKQYIDEYLTKTKKPIIGNRYKIPTLTNATRDGELENLDEFKVYLVKVKP